MWSSSFREQLPRNSINTPSTQPMDWSATPTKGHHSNTMTSGPTPTAIPGRAKLNAHTSKTMLFRATVLLLSFVCRTALGSTMSLPDGIENILGFVPTSNFRCERDGYFGDIDNDCRLFHLCQKQVSSSGKVEWRHWTYACGNQTMFNQLTLTCAFVDEAIPCRHASQFQYLNEVIHKPREPFLTDADVTSGISYYTNRVMSDGARNRAFEDSSLMAQLGGGNSGFVSTTQQFQQQNSNLNLNFQRPPQQQQQQQFFSSVSSNQFAPDTDDSSSRTINSIELPDLPTAFQSLSRQATVAIADQQLPDRRQDLVLINHSGLQREQQPQQREQRQQQQQLPQLQFFALPEARFNAAPVVPTTTTTTTAQPTTTTTTTTRERESFPSEQRQQVSLQQQQQQPNLASFNFAVSTDHQLGPSTSAHSTTLFTVNSQPQPSAAESERQSFQRQTTVASSQAAQVPSLPTTAPTTSALPATITSAPTAAAAAAAAAATTLATFAPTSTSTPLLSSSSAASRQAAEPIAATATTSSTTTTTSATSSRTGSGRMSSRATAAARSSSSLQQQQQQQQQNNRRPIARGDSGPLPIDAHPMRHFQSNRLSAMRQQPQPAESAVVMRRQPAPTAPTTVTSPGNQASGASFLAGVPLAAIDESEAFWRRPFDVQLMAPRFESLLTRRRV